MLIGETEQLDLRRGVEEFRRLAERRLFRTREDDGLFCFVLFRVFWKENL